MLIELLCLAASYFGLSSTNTSNAPGDLTLGITLNCPYGLGRCYPEVHGGLMLMPGIETLSEVADSSTWTCTIRMTNHQLLRPSDLSAYLHSLHAGASLRGIETTISGKIGVENHHFFLLSRNTKVPLERMVDTAYWDVANKRPLALTTAAKAAFQELSTTAQTGDSFTVTGFLKEVHDSEVPSLEVRSFSKGVGTPRTPPNDDNGDLFATLPLPIEIDESGYLPGENGTSRKLGGSVGSWSTVLRIPRPMIHAHLLPNGNVMFFSNDANIAALEQNGSVRALASAPYDIFCGGHTFLSDGRLFISGGQGPNPVNVNTGDDRAAIYDSETNKWTLLPGSGVHRWYPSVLQLPNGQVLTLSGSALASDSLEFVPQIWTGSSWQNLLGARKNLPDYPRIYLAPDSRVFLAGPNRQTLYLNTLGSGSWQNGPLRAFPAARDYGCSVMYEPGKILYMGGGSPPTSSTEAIDLTATQPSWTAMANMNGPRRQFNATLLPDGTVLATGGTYSSLLYDDPRKPVFQAEIWDPVTNTWSVMASQSIYRGYHSTATLMNDGRVVVSGGNAQQNMEIFSPPYLFKGTRPTILSAPTTVTSGSPFFLRLPAGETISKVSIIRLGSTTHAQNLDERFTWLNFSGKGSSIGVTAPTISPMLQAGYYQLFVLNAVGVPSVGKIIKLVPNQSAPITPN